jgi:hypothetical protein
MLDCLQKTTVSGRGVWIFSVLDSGVLKVWDARTSKKHLIRPVRTEVALNCAASTAGGLIPSPHHDRSIPVSEVTRNGGFRILEDHPGLVRACAIKRNGRLISSASAHGLVVGVMKVGTVTPTPV